MHFKEKNAEGPAGTVWLHGGVFECRRPTRTKKKLKEGVGLEL